jgi:hypothetical protein
MGAAKQSALDLAMQITQHVELEMLGELITEANGIRAQECEAFLKQLKDAKLSEPAIIAVGLLLPFKTVPKETFAHLLELTKSYPFLNSPSFAPKWRLAIAMRLVKSSLLASTSDQLIGEAGQMTLLYGKDPALFQVPYLYLCAQTKPIAISVSLIRDVDFLLLRRNIFALYYAGMNKLLLDKFEDADQDFLHAWTLSRGAKDLRETIAASLSLSSFLTGKSRALFESRVPRKYLPKNGPAHEIWDIDRADRIPMLTGNFQKFQNQLRLERARRVQADLAICVSRIEACQAGRLMALPEGHPDIKKFQGHDPLPLKRESLDEKIEQETALVLKLGGELSH